MSSRPGSNPSNPASLERGIVILARLLGDTKMRELREGVGETARVVVDGVAFWVSAGPLAPDPSANALFENPPPDDGQLPPGVTGKAKAVYAAVESLWAQLNRRVVRPRHVKDLMEKAGNIESEHTIKKELGRLVRVFGVLCRDPGRGYVLNRVSGNAQSSPPAAL